MVKARPDYPKKYSACVPDHIQRRLWPSLSAKAGDCPEGALSPGSAGANLDDLCISVRNYA